MSTLLTAAWLLQTAAVAPQSALAPGGPGAARIAELWWIMLAIGTLVILLVIALLGYALFRRRGPTGPFPEQQARDESTGRGREESGRRESERRGTRWIIIGGIAFPAVVLTVLFVFTLRTLDALSVRSDAMRRDELVIEVTGLQWWWRVRYIDPVPGRMFETANELHIPVGRRVLVRLRATDVIHSFWVPGLQGKLDMIPGKTNVTWLAADRPGVWRGQCAEYCGLQHAKMALVVVAEPPAEFERWLERQRAPAAMPGDSAALVAQRAFLASGCTPCHTVRGTDALGELGPDLTHLASRRTLAAATLPNTPGHLAGWITNPQAIKPGSFMPRVPLSAEQLALVLQYLGSLR
ncbi:MAG: cytochrome c oxidase subunit II [Gemmatimonadaceae bacterium]